MHVQSGCRYTKCVQHEGSACTSQCALSSKELALSLRARLSKELHRNSEILFILKMKNVVFDME